MPTYRVERYMTHGKPTFSTSSINPKSYRPSVHLPPSLCVPSSLFSFSFPLRGELNLAGIYFSVNRASLLTRALKRLAHSGWRLFFSTPKSKYSPCHMSAISR